MHAVAHHQGEKIKDKIEHHHGEEILNRKHKHNHHKDCVVVYSDEIEDKIDIIEEALVEKYGQLPNLRWHAIKELVQDKEIIEKYPLDLPDVLDRSYEKDIIKQKYDFIEEIIDEVLVNKAQKAASTERIDKYLTGKWLGLPIFLLIMHLYSSSHLL